MFTFNRKLTLVDALWVPLRIAPLSGGLYLLFTLVLALMPSVQILVVASFIRAATTDVGNLGVMAIPALQLLLTMALQMLLEPLRGFANLRLQMKLRSNLRLAYLEKLNKIEYHHIESPQVWDLINRLTLDFSKNNVYMEERFAEIFLQSVRLLQVVAGVGGVVTVLTMQIWWLGILMLAITAPMLVLSYKLGGRNYEMGEQHKNYMRASCNLGEVLLYRQYTFERFLFHFVPQINSKWAKNYRFICQQLFKLEMKTISVMKLGGILCTLMAVVLILVLSYLVAQGIVSFAIFIPMVTALFSLSQTLSWELAHCLYWLARTKGYFEDLTKFALLSQAEEVPGQAYPEPGPFASLEFRHVRFRYPGTERNVLDGVSFRMEKGGHYAFVGVNGAGKTTITKLITGLYSQYEGEILLNGIELRKLSPQRRKQLVSVVFQDFARYEIPFEDNILLGNPDATKEQIAKSVELVGLGELVKALPKGARTNLGKIKADGMDISGGEWQRIAMARAVVSPAAIKILDEPTAALDPLGESHVYEQFGQISRDATTIFISHRLGSTQLADVIFVLEGGRIVEQGNHEALMGNRAGYFAMYDSQRSWYL